MDQELTGFRLIHGGRQTVARPVSECPLQTGRSQQIWMTLYHRLFAEDL
jgi:hypothetical protein